MTSPIGRPIITRLLTIGLALASCLVVSMPATPAAALSGNDWKAGRIIDDSIFYNKDSMSVDQVQQFLNSKNPNCDNWGTQTYNGTTRRAYSESKGVKFPLTCLKEYYENPTTHENNLAKTDGQAALIPSGAQSAAQIIWNAAQQYTINPQVLIVLLQKEQILVQDDWPWPIQYQGATGYGCPDTAACDSQYYGFYNQVTNAAYQFRHYASNPNLFNFVPGNNNIQWSPNSSCGGSTVNIINQATASLYDYTPYQPNQAALNNLYGTGDSCSAYGNRNFWRYFNDWFGVSNADPFNWQPSRLLIMDEGKNLELPTDVMHPGERLFVTLTGTNTGAETWWRDGVNPPRLGTQNPRDHATPYCDITWLNLNQHCNRAATISEASVPAGGTYTFQFYTAVPNNMGQYWQYFKPLLEDRAWMTNNDSFSIYVNSTPYYNWQWLYFNAWTDSSKTTAVDMNNLASGQKAYIELKILNNSATVWTNSGNNPTRLGTQNPQDHNSFICDPSWVACDRPANLTEATVNPGQTGTFGFTIQVPNAIGEYREYFKPVIELKGWMRPDNNHIYMHVTH
jgi:hypothetical protein